MDLARSTSWADRAGLPRARGDGPDGRFWALSPPLASPRSRGWTPRRRGRGRARGGFPALAGMDPWPPKSAETEAWLPRARGDGPATSPASRTAPAASPRSRGWTRRCSQGRAAGDGFPALAGMDPASPASRRSPSWLPRARGDGPAPAAHSAQAAAASPRSRGWTQHPDPRRHRRGGFPALAGMDPQELTSAGESDWLPRARGDGPQHFDSQSPALPASPRSRGWTLSQSRLW